MLVFHCCLSMYYSFDEWRVMTWQAVRVKLLSHATYWTRTFMAPNIIVCEKVGSLGAQFGYAKVPVLYTFSWFYLPMCFDTALKSC